MYSHDNIQYRVRRLRRIALFLLLLTMAGASDKALEAISKSSSAFSKKLYKVLRDEPKNLFFSSTSLEVVLAMAYMGARGRTAEEIQIVMELPTDQKLIKDGYHGVMSTLKSTDNMILEIANRMYTEKTFAIEKDFKAVAEKSFLAAAEEKDFRGNPEGSRLEINGWVEKQTREKITNLFGQGDITPDTALVLVNALYFKGKWKHQFKPELTKNEPFYITPSESKDVPMMHIKKRFLYGELQKLKAKVLVMPYEGEKMSLMILLPDALDGLQDMENKLSSVDVAEILKATSVEEVEVSLPKFRIECTIQLNEPLKKLGMTSMFDPENADFSGITKKGGLFVSKVVQKAFIDVNEEGSEAAAATGMIMMMRCAMVNLDPPKLFRADHPFIFYLLNKETNVAIFQGLVASA